MDYRRLGESYYIRMDRGEEMIASLMDVCRREGIASATYSGIGGCQSAEIQIFDPETREFHTERIEGMLELVSFMGKVIRDESGEPYHHTHALYAFVEDGRHCVRGGHIRSSTVLYTAEIELCPVRGGDIGFMRDAETGTGFWRFSD